jgi:hypothetical protein
MDFVKLGTVCMAFAAAAAMAAETPSPALLVLNKADQALVIVEPASGKVAARLCRQLRPADTRQYDFGD